MKKELKNIQTFEQHTDKNLNISDVSDSDIIKMAEKYAKEQCEDVVEIKKYTPVEIYHLVKMVWIDGYKKQTYGGN